MAGKQPPPAASAPAKRSWFGFGGGAGPGPTATPTTATPATTTTATAAAKPADQKAATATAATAKTNSAAATAAAASAAAPALHAAAAVHSAGKQPAAASGGKWNCSVCTLENEQQFKKCQICGADRTGAGASDGAGEEDPGYSALDFFPMMHDNKSDPLLTPPMLEKLYGQIPTTLRLKDLKLLYSLADHGASIETLFRQCVNKGPTLLIVKDDKNYIFGAFLGDSWQTARNDYYGNGESFVMKLGNPDQPNAMPTFYKWSEAKSTNSFFHLAKENLIAVGGGDGFAIALGVGLRDGTSKPCSTYNSPPLASRADFKVHALEVWTFIESNHLND